MAYDLRVQCPACHIESPVTEDEVHGLESMISDERLEATQTAAALYFNPDYSDVTALTGGTRLLRELAVAIRRGDRAEAEHLLDVIATEIGDDAAEQVQQGRFSPEAKVRA